VTVAGVQLTHPERVLWPEDGITKADLAQYLADVAPVMLPHVRDRPISMQRFRDGVGRPGFFQKEIPQGAPPWVRTVEVGKRNGTVRHPLVNDRRSLVRLVIDLDPSTDDFGAVREAALACGDALRAEGLEPFAMVTGSRGIHVVAPLRRTRDVEDVLAWSRAFAQRFADAHPDVLTTEFHKAKRGDRIYVDVARNGAAQTVVPPYATRPRAGAPVATPLRWEELEDRGLRPDEWTMRTVLGRLDELGGDPWADIAKAARALPR
jgi:bifunctional non-homologous end joining protein LigD